MLAGTINLESVVPILKEHDVERASVFGSFARGEERVDSDIDLLVKFSSPKSLIDILRLENILSDKLARKVDLVTEKALHRYLRPYVMRDLKTIYG